MSEFILSPEGARRVDARLERAGLLDLTMEEAGRAVADAVQASFPDGPVLVLAGGGANGGDALVVARQLLALGRTGGAVSGRLAAFVEGWVPEPT